MTHQNINLAIGLPVNWEYIPVPFFESWVQMRKPKHSVIIGNRGRQDDQRNAIINQVLKEDSFSHILFLDIDHRFHPDTMVKLLSKDLPVVSGLSYRRSPPYDPIMFKYCNGVYKNILEWQNGELIEVDAVGGSCILVKTEVLKKMEYPWFEFYTGFDDSGKKISISEDIYFCKKSKDLGYKIFVDTSATNKHLSTLEVDHNIYKKFNKEIK